MSLDDTKQWLQVQRAIPGATADALPVAARGGRYGEQYVIPLGKPLYGLADGGQYFVATQGTSSLSAGIVGITAADGFNAAETLYLLYNTATETEGTRLYLDHIELQCSVVEANGTDISVDVHVDTGDRFTSGGTAITPVNPNMHSTASPKGRLRFGAIISTSASNSVRCVYCKKLSTTDLVVDDVIRFEFAATAAAVPAPALHQVAEGTTGRVWTLPCPPVILGPNQSLMMSVNCASQSATGATWTFNTGWAER